MGWSIIDNLSAAFPNSKIAMSEGGSRTKHSLRFPDRTVEYEANWFSPSKDWRRRNTLGHLRLLQMISKLIPGFRSHWFRNQTLNQMNNADVVLDISAGDSFACIYGEKNFNSQIALKQAILAMRKPLILLPQTIGPFNTESSLRQAKRVVEGSILTATREAQGLKECEQWFGPLDDRFLVCPDIAISMPPIPIPNFRVKSNENHGNLLIGLNVSGLLWQTNQDFSLRADYRQLTEEIVEWIMSTSTNQLILVPHVFNPHLQQMARAEGLYEYPELELNQQLAAKFRGRWGNRIQIVDQAYSAPELKWIIGQCDLFIGARMHACIAALSQAVPTVILAYSKKASATLGVLDATDLVVDLRVSYGNEAVNKIEKIFRDRDSWGIKLERSRHLATSQIRDFFRVQLLRAIVAQSHNQ